MKVVDARALLNDFDFCKAQAPFKISCEALTYLNDRVEADGDDAANAARICDWLLANRNTGMYHVAYDDGDTTCDFTGEYTTALIDGARYVPKAVDKTVEYKGYMVVAGDAAAPIYSNTPIDGCENGQYVLVSGDDGICDARRWDGSGWRKLKPLSFISEMLGTVEPRDYYQRCAFDSLRCDDITVLFGNSGTGKTLLPLAYLMQELESGRLTRCHMIYHYEKLKYSRELGYVKGTLQDKLLQTGAIGNILASKMGGRDEIIHMISNGVINIMPTNAIRGFEAGETEAIYCTEAQDMDAYTTRTIIQRARKGCKVIFEGDVAEQVDISRRSGLGQLIDVFKGTQGFGCMELKHDYRSPYGRIADRIR